MASASRRSGDAMAATTVDADAAPAHAIALPGGEWQVWREFVLRGAGFPVSLALDVIADAAAAAADRWLDAAHAAAVCRRDALDVIRRASCDADPETRRRLRARRRKLAKDIVIAAPRTVEDEAFARALAIRAEAAAAYRAIFEREAAAEQDRLAHAAADPRFREASLWQNHRATITAARALASGQERRARRAAALVAMQIQRYALKNDSVGFFGPVAWGRFVAEPWSLDLTPGATLVDRREVFFEGWCLDALCDRFAADPALRPWTPPRVMAGVWSDAAHVYAPAVGVVPLSPVQRRVFDACDGRTARAIALALVERTAPDFADEAGVFRVLESLVRLRLVAWRFEVPSQLYPERGVAERIAAIGDPALRAGCAAALERLIAARDRVAAAAGSPDDLAVALGALDATFVRLTGRDPVRRAGKMYAARGLVYEDCRRAGAIALGQHVLDRLGPPLSLMLDGARWAAAELAAAMRRHLRRAHAELCDGRGGAVDGHRFFEAIGRSGATAAIPADVQARVRERWQSILQIDYAAARVTRTLADVRARAADAFRPAAAPWSRAQHIGPDLLIAAKGPDAFRRGAFHGVLGELHSTNSLVWSVFTTQHPDRRALADAVARDTAGQTTVVAQMPKAIWLARIVMSIHPPGVWQFRFGGEPPNHVDGRAAPAALFEAIDDGESIVMRARDGSLVFDALELFAIQLSAEADRLAGHFLEDAPHVPRVTIDDLTIARERWHVRPDAMPFLAARDRAAEFAGVRAWARAHGLPPRVFYRSPIERKPCFLDLRSPIYTALFAKMMRQVPPDATVRIEEMLPDGGDTWLVDAAGARYTSELRLVARRRS